MSSRYRIFLNVYENGSFSETAEAMGYSQSAISQAVHALESELGTSLLKRRREGITLTEDGKTYLPYFQAIVAAEDKLEEKKKEMDGLVNETIRIGTFTSVSRNLLPRLISSFQKLYPQAKFELRQGEYDNFHEWLLRGEIDFAFMNPKGFDDLYIQEIYRDSMLAVLPKGHRLAKKETVSLNDLIDDPFILLDEGRNSVPLEAFKKAGIEPQVAYKVYDDYSILAMVRQNMGISILYGLVVQGFEDGVEVRPIAEKVERRLAVACADPALMSGASARFMKYVLAETPDILKDRVME